MFRLPKSNNHYMADFVTAALKASRIMGIISPMCCEKITANLELYNIKSFCGKKKANYISQIGDLPLKFYNMYFRWRKNHSRKQTEKLSADNKDIKCN